jgi:hypothetical protein
MFLDDVGHVLIVHDVGFEGWSDGLGNCDVDLSADLDCHNAGLGPEYMFSA